jgi:ATPase subunit of ABC transporter with duplicated ATPase domains
MLSGGERNRLHLANLKEEKRIALDEPTNDLDINTLVP